MINTDYSSMYGQMMNARNNGKVNGRATDKSKLSKNMDYLEKAKAKASQTGEKATRKKESSDAKRTDGKELTVEDLQKLYAEFNGINYGSYDSKDSYRQMANSFLNQMVFSNMGSSKELFVPQMSNNVLSAAFNAAYDYSDVEDKIRQSEEPNPSEDRDTFNSDDKE